MSKSRSKIARREFVGEVSKGLLAAGGALAAGNPAPSARAEPAVASPTAKAMPSVVLGRTGLRVSKLSLGTCPPTSRPVFAYCVEQGVTYFDSAEGYSNGQAEAGLGDLMKELRLDRGKFCLSTKQYDREPSHWAPKLAESLKRLRTGYVDLFFVHDLGIHQKQPTDLDPLWISRRDVIEGAKALKKSGLIRHFGFSVHHRRPQHTFGLLREAITSDVVDVIMIQYSFRDEKNEALRKALADVRKANIALIACKPQGLNAPIPENLKSYLSDGFNRWQAAIRWLANDGMMDVICANMLNLEQAQQNIAAVKAPPLRAAEAQSLRMYALATSSVCCRQCGACLDVCPRQLDVPTILRALVYHENYGLPEQARDTYASIPPQWRADRCLCDGACEGACPNGLQIRRRLECAADLFRGMA